MGNLSTQQPEEGNIRTNKREESGKPAQYDDVLFVGDSDFVALFGSFGFKVSEAATREDFVRILEGFNTGEVNPPVLIFAQSTLMISDEEISQKPESGRINIVFLPSQPPDVESVRAMYKSISERASGVDLTRKL